MLDVAEVGEDNVGKKERDVILMRRRAMRGEVEDCKSRCRRIDVLLNGGGVMSILEVGQGTVLLFLSDGGRNLTIAQTQNQNQERRNIRRNALSPRETRESLLPSYTHHNLSHTVSFQAISPLP